MSKNHRSWEQPKRDLIKDLENYREYILKQALMPRKHRPFLIGSKTYEFLLTIYPDFLKGYEVEVFTAPVPEPDPTQQ